MRLSDQAQAFLAIEAPTAPMHSTAIVLVEGDLSEADLLSHVAARLSALPHHQQRLHPAPLPMTPPVLVNDESFDLKRHVGVTEMPPDTPAAAAPLLALRLSAGALPRQQPLWRLHLVRGLGSRCMLVYVVHHAILPGPTALSASEVLLGPPRDNTRPEKPPEDDLPEDPRAQLADLLSSHTAAFGQRLARLSELAGPSGSGLEQAAASVLRLLARPVQAAPWNEGSLQGGRRLDSRVYSATQLSVAGATERDVLLTLLAEALARYRTKANEASTEGSTRFLCPVNASSGEGAGPHLTATCPTLAARPLGAHARLAEVCAENARAETEREAQALELVMALTPPLPPPGGSSVQAPPMAPFWQPAAQPGVLPWTIDAQNPLDILRLDRHPVPGRDGPRRTAFTLVCSFARTQQAPAVAGLPVVEQHLLPALSQGLGLAVHVTLSARAAVVDIAGDPASGVDTGALADHMSEVLAELTTVG